MYIHVRRIAPVYCMYVYTCTYACCTCMLSECSAAEMHVINVSPFSPTQITRCVVCDLLYHKSCLLDHQSTLGKGAWKCARCTKCVSCGTTSPGLVRHGTSLAIFLRLYTRIVCTYMYVYMYNCAGAHSVHILI